MKLADPLRGILALLLELLGNKCFLFIGLGSCKELTNMKFLGLFCCDVKRLCLKNEANTEENRAEKYRDRINPG